MGRCTIVAGLAISVLAVAQAQPTTQPTAEAKLVRDLYGNRIAQALARPEAKENIALAQELLLAAGDSANPAPLRHLLAMEAVKVASSQGSAEAAKLAREALALADKLKTLTPTVKWNLELQIAERRYEAARKSGVAMIDRAPLAAKVVQAQIGLAKVLMAEESLDLARVRLNAARAIARAHRLAGAEADAEAAAAALKAFTLRLDRIHKAEAQLERAKPAGNEEAMRSARQTLGLIYLLSDGDLAKANSYLAHTGHTYEAPVKAALEFTLNPKQLPPVQACNDIVEALGQAAKAAENGPAQVRIATAGMNLCRAFLASRPSGLVATKARLLLMRMEKLAGDSPADRLVKKLKASYGSLEGKLEVLQKGVVRASYDFSSQKQLDDWSSKEGDWQVARTRGKDVLVGSPQGRSRARLESRLRFYANKPLSVSFLASGREDLVGVLVFLKQNDQRWGTHTLEFMLGAYGNRESVLRDSGWPVWSDRRAKIVPNTTYSITISWDGQQAVTWAVNGKALCKHQIRYSKDDISRSSVVVGLQTRGAGAGFDDVKVEGVIMVDPSQRLP